MQLRHRSLRQIAKRLRINACAIGITFQRKDERLNVRIAIKLPFKKGREIRAAVHEPSAALFVLPPER